MKQTRFHAVLSALIDMIWAGFLWLLCSLPVLTIGASSTALYYVTVKCVRHERGSLTRSFFRCFRENFRQATLLLLLLVLYVLIGLADIRILGSMGLRQFEPVYMLTNGGPNHRTSTMVLYMYERLQSESYGLASATAVILIVVGVIFIVCIRKLFNGRSEAAELRRKTRRAVR